MGNAVWLDLDQAALDAAYDQRVWAPDAAEWIARYAADTAAAPRRNSRWLLK